MSYKMVFATAISASVLVAPMAALGGTRASDNPQAVEVAVAGVSGDVARLCGKIAATNSGVADASCSADFSLAQRTDVDRLCEKIQAYDLDVDDEVCSSRASPPVEEEAGLVGAAGVAAGAGLAGAGAAAPIAAATAAVAGGVAAASSSGSTLSRGAN